MSVQECMHLHIHARVSITGAWLNCAVDWGLLFIEFKSGLSQLIGVHQETDDFTCTFLTLCGKYLFSPVCSLIRAGAITCISLSLCSNYLFVATSKGQIEIFTSDQAVKNQVCNASTCSLLDQLQFAHSSILLCVPPWSDVWPGCQELCAQNNDFCPRALWTSMHATWRNFPYAGHNCTAALGSDERQGHQPCGAVVASSCSCWGLSWTVFVGLKWLVCCILIPINSKDPDLSCRNAEFQIRVTK